MRPLCQKLQHRGINGDGRPPARHSRASLQDLVTASIVVLTGMDALPLDTLERPYRIQSRLASSHSASVIPLRRRVGTHGLCVRCVKSYSIVVLTGMDALPLDTLERPYRIQSRLASSHSASIIPPLGLAF